MSERDPAGSKTDPPLGKAEPIRNSGSTSVVAYLRKRKMLPIRSWDRRVRICKRNNSLAPRSVQKEREEVVQAYNQGFSYSLQRECSGTFFLAFHGYPPWSKQPPAACRQPHISAGEQPLKAAVSYEGSMLELLTGSAAHGENTTEEQVCCQTCDPVRKDSTPQQDPCWNSQPVGRIYVGEVHEGLSPMGKP